MAIKHRTVRIGGKEQEVEWDTELGGPVVRDDSDSKPAPKATKQTTPEPQTGPAKQTK